MGLLQGAQSMTPDVSVPAESAPSGDIEEGMRATACVVVQARL
jgi:hypothetical protein